MTSPFTLWLLYHSAHETSFRRKLRSRQTFNRNWIKSSGGSIAQTKPMCQHLTLVFWTVKSSSKPSKYWPVYVCVMNPCGKLPLWSFKKSISQIYRFVEHNCFIFTHLTEKTMTPKMTQKVHLGLSGDFLFCFVLFLYFWEEILV